MLMPMMTVVTVVMTTTKAKVTVMAAMMTPFRETKHCPSVATGGR
jgi:hypothetical protein